MKQRPGGNTQARKADERRLNDAAAECKAQGYRVVKLDQKAEWWDASKGRAVPTYVVEEER